MKDGNEGMGRRDLLKLGTIGAIGLMATGGSFLGRADQAHADEMLAGEPLFSPGVSPDAALAQLMEGNQRFVEQQLKFPDHSMARLHEVAQAQHPFVTILSCADSRVSAEIVFDQGIGDIFDVRIAGNIATPEAIGSIEFAVALLGTPLLMVMGHERCGAVTAAVKNQPLPGNIGSFVEAILPAVNRVKGLPGDAVDNAVVANVQYQIEQLRRSPLLMERLQSGKLKIVGSRYDLDTGKVTMLA